MSYSKNQILAALEKIAAYSKPALRSASEFEKALADYLMKGKKIKKLPPGKAKGSTLPPSGKYTGQYKAVKYSPEEMKRRLINK